MEKTKPNTTKARNVLQHKINTKTKIRPGNGAGLFSKEKISRKVISKKKVKKKRISGDAYDKNKPAIYIWCRNQNRIKGALCSGAHTGQVNMVNQLIPDVLVAPTFLNES